MAASVLGADGAQAKFDVTINGAFWAIYGFVKENDDPGDQGFRRQNQALNQDAELRFNFKQTFDNGITAGGRVAMKGQTNGGALPVNSGSAGFDQIDEKWGYLRGGFGELRFGDDDDVRRQMATAAPFASVLFQANSPPFTFNNYQLPAGHAVFTNSTSPFLELESAKLIYFTPMMRGFQLGLPMRPMRRRIARRPAPAARTSFNSPTPSPLPGPIPARLAERNSALRWASPAPMPRCRPLTIRRPGMRA